MTTDSFRPAPHNHILSITARRGKQIRGEVIYAQPVAERATSGTDQDIAEVHITTCDWLEPYRYPAIYNTPKQSVAGIYAVYRYSLEDGVYSFEATFAKTKAQNLIAH
jgi:hypothetical protein